MVCKAILIVEDEIEIRENLMALMQLEGYAVYGASNGKEALDLLHTVPRPCLILLDLLMPVMSGTEFLEAVSHEDLMATIPVCVVSGVADRPKLPGHVAFVKKPMDFDVLLQWVRHHCGAPSEASEADGPEPVGGSK